MISPAISKSEEGTDGGAFFFLAGKRPGRLPKAKEQTFSFLMDLDGGWPEVCRSPSPCPFITESYGLSISHKAAGREGSSWMTHTWLGFLPPCCAGHECIQCRSDPK